MRRWIAWLLCVALTLLCTGCLTFGEESEEETDMVCPMRFYYCSTAQRTADVAGALAWELRDMGRESPTPASVLELYLQGPLSSETLVSPFPDAMAVEHVSLEEGVLVLSLDSSFAALTGVRRTMAAACLVYTMTQLDGVESVQFLATSGVMTELLSEPLQPEDFLLSDSTDGGDMETVTLYFSDANVRYLVEETRTCTVDTEEELPAYVLSQLLQGPRTSGSQATLPEGTALLAVQVENGLCTVDFSEAFCLNWPQTWAEERMMVLSVVNSLTELSGIECVRFLCGGESLDAYHDMDLSQPLYRDESAVSQAYTADTVYDASLYLPFGGDGKLAAVPTYVRRSASRPLYSDVLNALLNRKTVNGCENPIPNGTLAVRMELTGGTCSVTFNSAFALCDADAAQAQAAVRAVVATLCALRDVDQVQIEIYNSKLTSVDLSEPLSPSADWFLS